MKCSTKHLFFLSPLSLFVSYQVSAASGIETLVVTAKSPLDITAAHQLSADELIPGSRHDAAEWLQGALGVQADSRSNYAQDTRITLRGFGARSAFGVRGVDLQIDGIPLTMPDGQGQFSGAVLDGVKYINVLSGQSRRFMEMPQAALLVCRQPRPNPAVLRWVVRWMKQVWRANN